MYLCSINTSMWFIPGAYERHSEKERLTSIPILCQITLQNAPYKDYKLLVLTSFEVATVTTMDSQEPACWLLNETERYTLSPMQLIRLYLSRDEDG